MKRIRCAIYTRKSSDEGLDQNFNSLDAQRDACEAYVQSQKHEGWKALPARFDDGGASGGNMDRVALQRLLFEIDQGRVDMVVVYKIDRLTRSLADFAKLVDRLDAAGASFVSVTQQFNTSTSMGRLTLNVLLSFAQFEREVTAERIRDKIAASKAKGLWMGGLVPLGYNKGDNGLVINQEEALIVRALFEGYLELGSVRALKEVADRKSYRTKTRTLQSGKIIHGKLFSRGRLYHLLSNPIYIGKIRHKELRHDGVPDAIISDDLWKGVQAKLQQNAIERKSRKNSANPSPLAGRVFDENGAPLTSSHARKSGRRYRYYVSKDVKIRLAALELEGAVRHAMETHRDIQLHLKRNHRSCEDLLNLVERVTLFDAKIRIELKEGVQPQHIDADFVRRRRGIENKLILNSGSIRKPDKVLIRRILKAMTWLDQIKRGQGISEIAATENVSPEYITHNLGLGLLSPGILRAISAGSQRPDISAYQLSKMAIPADWNAQKSFFLEQVELP